MNIPEIQTAYVYQNGKWDTFKSIGSYKFIYENVVDLLIPEDVLDINVWRALSAEMNPIILFLNLWDLKNKYDEAFAKEIYGHTFYTNYLNASSEVNEILSMLLDELSQLNENNILIVSKGDSINFDSDFAWSENYEWARRDNDFIVLFEEYTDRDSAFVRDEIYPEIIKLFNDVWEKIIAK